MKKSLANALVKGVIMKALERGDTTENILFFAKECGFDVDNVESAVVYNKEKNQLILRYRGKYTYHFVMPIEEVKEEESDEQTEGELAETVKEQSPSPTEAPTETPKEETAKATQSELGTDFYKMLKVKSMADNRKKIDQIAQRVEKLIRDVGAIKAEVEEEMGDFSELQKWGEQYRKTKAAANTLRNILDSLDGVNIEIEDAREFL